MKDELDKVLLPGSLKSNFSKGEHNEGNLDSFKDSYVKEEADDNDNNLRLKNENIAKVKVEDISDAMVPATTVSRFQMPTSHQIGGRQTSMPQLTKNHMRSELYVSYRSR